MDTNFASGDQTKSDKRCRKRTSRGFRFTPVLASFRKLNFAFGAVKVTRYAPVRAATLLLLCFTGGPIASAACDAAHTINVTMPEGSKWQMCWSLDDKAGIVLNDVYYQTASDDSQPAVRRKVLGDAHLAQLHVNYDDGSSATDYVNDVGLGKTRIRKLHRADCFGESARLYREGGKRVLCSRIRDRGHLYKYKTTDIRLGHELEVFSVHDIGRHTWIVSWLFLEDGTIAPRLGTTGSLEQYGRNINYGAKVGRTRIAKSWVYNAFWRLNFDLDGRLNDAVEEISVVKSGPGLTRQSLRVKQIDSETGRALQPSTMRSWRVLDTVTTTPLENHQISYHLVPQQGGMKFKSSREPWSNYELYVTKNRGCERFIEKSNNTNCGGGISRFVNDQNVYDADVVIWYGISRHHLPRDEDEPYRSLQWDEFRLYPRDWTDDTPLG